MAWAARAIHASRLRPRRAFAAARVGTGGEALREAVAIGAADIEARRLVSMRTGRTVLADLSRPLQGQPVGGETAIHGEDRHRICSGRCAAARLAHRRDTRLRVPRRASSFESCERIRSECVLESQHELLIDPELGASEILRDRNCVLQAHAMTRLRGEVDPHGQIEPRSCLAGRVGGLDRTHDSRVVACEEIYHTLSCFPAQYHRYAASCQPREHRINKAFLLKSNLPHGAY